MKGVTVSQPQPRIHITDMQAFMTCRRRWNWSSALRENLTSNAMYAPFFMGRLVHHNLEHLYRYGLSLEVALGMFLKEELGHRVEHLRTEPHERVAKLLWPQEIDEIRNVVVEAKQILEHYRIWARAYRGPFNDDEFDFISHERVFCVPFMRPDGTADPDMLQEGRFDGLVRRKSDGTVWLWEVKTARSIKERIQMLPYEMQASAYCRAAEIVFGEPVAGVIYTIIRKKVPRDPDVLANGMLSKNKSIDTTAEHYLKCVRRHHGVRATVPFIKQNYGDILMKLRERAEDPQHAFFARIGIRRSPEELRVFQEGFHACAREMINPDTPIYPSPGYHCSFCLFKEPCLDLNTGRDVQTTLDLLFQKRTNDYEGVPVDFNQEGL